MSTTQHRSACTYTIETSQNITYICVTGVVDGTSLRKILEEIWTGKDYQHPCILWDFRVSVAGLGIEDVRRISQFVKNQGDARGYGRVAMVVDHHLNEQYARMYELLSQSLPFEVKTFRDVGSAEGWLRELFE